ncbi:helicase-related protein [Pigmentibacter ruber]|uniref:helicase-related protein n=1 Tax=Pigmentibacter ruber TaxID=2683196 RepID=UPI00131A9F9F|nr:helicase-related protein [Pigmentibacter ruber]
MEIEFSPGSLVKARGREWTVLPGSTKDLYLLRPLAGGNEKLATGILSELEEIEPAEFLFPRLEDASDAVSARILRDAARLSIRSGVGPFRSFSRISVEPRPYQLVPLMLALRQETEAIRLLIADDVGVGKTVEGMLIVRELLDRHEIKNFAVLCPAHLVSQWASELKNKFHINAVEVTARKADILEKNCSPGKGIFDEYPYTIISIDFIKSERNKNEFLAKCPDLIVVDEAHECADAGTKEGRQQQQRHKLLKEISKNPTKNILLLTATPHSGKMHAFRSLISILNADFASKLPDDFSGEKNRVLREELAKYFVQRRRADIKDYLGCSIFPKRIPLTVKYPFVESNKILTQKLLEQAKEFFSIDEPMPGSKQFNKQTLWWSCFTLALALCSSPYAALTSLCRRSRLLAAKNISDLNKQGEQNIFGVKDSPYDEDYADNDSEEDLLYDEFTPGSRGETEENDIISYLNLGNIKENNKPKDTLLKEQKKEIAIPEKGKKGRKKKTEVNENSNTETAEFNLNNSITDMLTNLTGKEKLLAQNFIAHTAKADAKLQALIQNVLLTDCFKAKRNVVIFCRFIDTAQYLYHELSQDEALNNANIKQKLNCEIRTLTGKVSPEERDYILDQLKEHNGLKILVCTDCLSEGVNLQELFDTVVHYDYSWNPNRHEQREGRIDRLLQKSEEVYCYYMHADGHPIEKLFIEINEKKQENIERSLGVRFQMSDIFSELQFEENKKTKKEQSQVTLFDDSQSQQLFVENAFRFKKQSILTIPQKIEEQKKSQTYYSHEGVKIDQVETQLKLMRQALGSDTDVERFFINVLERTKGQFKKLKSGIYDLEIPEKTLAQRIFPQVKENQSYKLAFALGLKEQSDKVILRTSPEVEDLARSVLEAALDPLLTKHPLKCASRAGVMRTSSVSKRTTVILARLRYLLREEKDSERSLVEEIIPLLFEGSPTQFSPEVCKFGEEVETFLNNTLPQGNISTAERERFLKPLLESSKLICNELQLWQQNVRTQELIQIHKNIRAQRTVRRIQIDAVGLPDILGMYVFLPVNIGSGV